MTDLAGEDWTPTSCSALAGEPSVHAQIFDKGCVECHSNHAVLKPSDEITIGSQISPMIAPKFAKVKS